MRQAPTSLQSDLASDLEERSELMRASRASSRYADVSASTTTIPPTTTTHIHTPTTKKPPSQPRATIVPKKDTASRAEIPEGDIWYKLAFCETGGKMNQDATSSSGTYRGYFQFSMTTWHSVGGPGDPRDHDYGTQLQYAQKLQARSGWNQWPRCARRLNLLQKELNIQPRSKYDNGRIAAPIIERIRNRCVENEQGCWVWTGIRVGDGYGRTKIGSRRDGTERQILCHVAIWEEIYGPKPLGMTLDHVVCDNPPCCNPDHLALATMRDNTLRSMTSPTAVNARKTHCSKGHPFFGENLRMSGASRICRTCQGWTNRTDLIRLQEQICGYCKSVFLKTYRSECCSKTCAMFLRYKT